MKNDHKIAQFRCTSSYPPPSVLLFDATGTDIVGFKKTTQSGSGRGGGGKLFLVLTVPSVLTSADALTRIRAAAGNIRILITMLPDLGYCCTEYYFSPLRIKSRRCWVGRDLLLRPVVPPKLPPLLRTLGLEPWHLLTPQAYVTCLDRNHTIEFDHQHQHEVELVGFEKCSSYSTSSSLVWMFSFEERVAAVIISYQWDAAGTSACAGVEL